MDKDEKILELEQRIVDIKKELEELKDGDSYVKFEDGDWLRLSFNSDMNTYFIFKHKNVKGEYGNTACYLGINFNHKKVISFFENHPNFTCLTDPAFVIKKATSEEIKNTLEKFAEKKGFKNGIKYKPANGEERTNILLDISSFGILGLHLTSFEYGGSSGFIYNNETNTWAKIIKDFEIVPGYPVEFISPEACEIYGVRFTKDRIKTLQKAITDVNRNNSISIQSLNVGCDGQFKLTPTTLNELLANWPK